MPLTLKSLNPFKKNIIATNEKAARKDNMRISDFINYLNACGWCNVTASLAMQLYDKNATLADSVDMIKDECKSIEPVIMRDYEVLYEHKVLDSLRKPNPKQNYVKFIESIAMYKILTGNAFLVALGNTKTAPLEMYSMPSTAVYAIGSSEDYKFEANNSNALLFLDGSYPYDKKTGRYINQNMMKEVVHFNRFINYTTTDGYLANSMLSSIFYELELLNNGNQHNLALLLNGVNLNGVFNVKTNDKAAVEQFKKDVSTYFAGASNANKYLVSQNETITFTPIQANNKDMQYIENTAQARKVVYDRFRIPEPLRNGNAATYDNYKTAQGVFYDKAVLPELKDILATLTDFYRNRKMLLPNEFITFDPTSIPALQDRYLNEIKLKKEIGVNTNNELRNYLGEDPLGEENDILYQESSKVPVGFMNSAFDETTPVDEQVKRFSDILRRKGLSEETIKEKVKSVYANCKE